MATKKVAEKQAPAPVAKMTKTQIVKTMAEKLAVEPKQVQVFFDVLVRRQQSRRVKRESSLFLVSVSS